MITTKYNKAVDPDEDDFMTDQEESAQEEQDDAHAIEVDNDVDEPDPEDESLFEDPLYDPEDEDDED